jgi:GT2 family glycosyltransferase
MSLGLVDQFVVDPEMGLPGAINKGFSELPSEVEYINWLGDDDLVSTGSIAKAVSVLDSDSKTVLVYGSCDYVDPQGKVIWTNKSGQWVSTILGFGPDLIPQPGCLFRRSAFNQIGGLNKDFNWAFDFDLLLNLKKVGGLKFLDATLSSFRWHPESLSVEFRAKSVAEASKVRVSHLPSRLRPISWLWEYPVKKATFFAGLRVTERAKKLAS